MAQYNHPNCAHPQPHCPFCDCDDCYRLAQLEVRRSSSSGVANDQHAAAAPVAPTAVIPAAASQPPRGQWPSWLASPSSRFVVIAGVTALTVGFWMASHRRSHRLILHHRILPSAMPLQTAVPPPAPSSLPAGMGQYEAGFLKGSEVTAAMYRAMHASAADAWRSQLGSRAWCRYKGS